MKLFLLLFFTLASGFFSLAQISLFSLSSTDLKLYNQSRDGRKILIANILKKPRDLLVVLLFGDIVANILIQNSSANIFGNDSTWVLIVGVPLVISLFIGEIVPKTIGLSYNKAVAYRIVKLVDWLQKVLSPLLRFLTSLTTYLSRVLFFFLRKEQEISIDELRHVLQHSEESGILRIDESKLISGYLSLTDFTIKERMHPRSEIIYYDINEPLSVLISLFTDKECSRVPVCDTDLQNMRGIISAKTLFMHRKQISKGADLLLFLDKPYYIPETISARTLLHNFLHQKQVIGIVVDEYGSISGLITREDLFEIVVGEIVDSRDKKSMYSTAGKDVIIASGKFEISEFEELFDVELPNESNMVTVGGWLTERLGDIPRSGTKYEWDGFLFHVLSADPTHVRRVYIRRTKNE